jgi:hypothetical protein
VLIIISLSLVFGALGFLYSFVGFFDHRTENIIRLDPFRTLTIEEIGGHFLFGFIVAIPFKNLKISILTGLMALTIDADHLLNVTGFHIQGRIDHSITFAILSSILMSILASKIYSKIANTNQVILPSFLSTSSAAAIMCNHNRNSTEKESKPKHTIHTINTELIEGNVIFQLFLLITLAAFLSHIAYDVFVDDKARFPLLAPFSYNQFVIPRTYGIPIVVAGFVLLFIIYQLYLPYHNSNTNRQFSVSKKHH